MNKKYKVFTGGMLPIKGGINGPILTPVELDNSEVILLITKGYDVREVNPYNEKECVRLTRLNHNKIKFTKPEKEITGKVYSAPKPGDKLFPENPKVLPKKFVESTETPDFF